MSNDPLRQIATDLRMLEGFIERHRKGRRQHARNELEQAARYVGIAAALIERLNMPPAKRYKP